MTDDFQPEGEFVLSYHHPNGDSYRFAFNEPLTWPQALSKMVTFLSNVYGYDLTDQVAITKPRGLVDNFEWPGPFFGKEATTEEASYSAGLTD